MIKHQYFKIFKRTINTPKAWQEDRSRWYHSQPLHNSRVRHSEEGVNAIHRWIIQVAFEVKVVSKMCKNCFFFKSRLISRLNSWVALKIKVDIKMRQIPRFYPTQCVKGKIKVIFKIFIEVHFLFNLSRTWLNTKKKMFLSYSTRKRKNETIF